MRPGNAGSGIVVYGAGELARLWFGLYTPVGTNNTAELTAHTAPVLDPTPEVDWAARRGAPIAEVIGCLTDGTPSLRSVS